MANETRHAAWQSERSFAVRLLPEEGPPTELAGGLSDFLDAVDFAVEWLTREDPERTGTANLAIFETSAGETEKVWAYPPDQLRDGDPLMKIFGFDPVNWKSAASDYAPRGPAKGTFFTRPDETVPPPKVTPDPPSPTSSPAPPPPVTPAPPKPSSSPAPPPVTPDPPKPSSSPAPPPPVTPAPPKPSSSPAPPRVVLRPPQPTLVMAAHDTTDFDEGPATAHTHVEFRRALAAAWDDPVARSFLFLAGVSLWLALAFSNASLLALVLVALSGLWWRRDKLVTTAKADRDDWM